ncbi:MAG: DUF624 domain-containing protein [Ruminococcaceae bacterium]|nr:DUF624 domain-containing protein [Oscillospiraceae bacterium]
MATKKNNKNKRHLLYDIFNPRGNGKGLTKEEIAQPRTLSRFFRFYSTHFNTMFVLNLFAFLGNFPLLFGMYALTGALNINSSAPASSLFAPLYGAMQFEGQNPVTAALFGIHGMQAPISMPTKATYVFFGLTLLVFFTFGLVNLSTYYVMRNIVKGEPSMFLSDVKYAIKRNWKQGMLLGILDLLFICIIIYDLLIFRLSTGSFYSFLFGVMLIVAMLYSMMRYYMYIMLVTFDLSLWKILKNAFIFSILGFKRNIVAFLATIAVWVIDYVILNTFFPLGVILPILFLVSLTNFMGIYAAYPKVKEIMIDPYYVSDNVGARKRTDPPEESENADEEPIFVDRG